MGNDYINKIYERIIALTTLHLISRRYFSGPSLMNMHVHVSIERFTLIPIGIE